MQAEHTIDIVKSAGQYHFLFARHTLELTFTDKPLAVFKIDILLGRRRDQTHSAGKLVSGAGFMKCRQHCRAYSHLYAVAAGMKRLPSIVSIDKHRVHIDDDGNMIAALAKRCFKPCERETIRILYTFSAQIVCQNASGLKLLEADFRNSKKLISK
jgi:hypothetical protein